MFYVYYQAKGEEYRLYTATYTRKQANVYKRYLERFGYKVNVKCKK